MDAMLDMMPATMLDEWVAYFQLDPFGGEREDLRAGIIAATVANAFRGKGRRAFSAGDFMPRFEPRKPQDPEQMRAAWEAFCAAANNRR